VAAALVALFSVLTLAVLPASGVAAAKSPAASWAGAGVTLPSDTATPAESTIGSTSCPAPGNCVAVGAYETSSHTSKGLIEIQSGGAWRAMAAPSVAGAPSSDVDLLSVSCPSVGSCVAAGIQEGGSAPEALVLVQSGSAWKATLAPRPGNASPYSFLLSVSCGAAGSCAAVGVYQDTGGHSQGLLLALAGGVWKATEASLPAGAAPNPQALFVAVSCGGAGSCTAVGTYHSAATAEGIVATLSGGAWTTAPIPLPADSATDADVEMEGISCAAAGVCTAVGGYERTTGSVRSLVVSVHGGTVASVTPPLPANAKTSGTGPPPGDIMVGISCPTTSYCMAVGGYASTANTGNGATPLIETWSGGVWTPTVPPGSFAPGNDTYLVGVSCSWPGSCTATGLDEESGSNTAPVETLTNGKWTETTAILPANAPTPNHISFGFEIVFGTPVSCVSGTCVLAGTYQASGGLDGGFINLFPNLTGYQMVASDGGLFAFNTPFFGSMGGQALNEPVVGMAVVPDGGGYYEVASDGGIFAFHAPFFGSMGGQHLNAPIVGIAFDSRTGGYYEVASDGGIFAFNAPFLGSMGGQHLNKPIVGIAFDPATGGYYEVASDGGIFAFGAPYHGSTGGITLNKPVVGMTVDTTTGGYYEVASDGGLFAFNAPFQGSTGNLTINQPVVGMAYDYLTGGYYEVASDGGIFAFNAPFQGSTGNLTLNQPVVGMAFG
jgi:hypothetical protein